MNHELYRRTILGLLEDQLRAEPHETEAHHREVLWQHVRGIEEYLRLLFDNWFNANWPFIRVTTTDDATVVTRIRRRRAGTRRRAAKAVRQAAGVILMSLPMPCGKLLRDCTGAEASRAGGWFALIAQHVRPTQVVGKVLTEQQLKNLYGRNAARAA